MRAPLSVALITLNAGRALTAALASVRFADDIVVIDSGSSDATVTIARAAGARVIDAPWRGFGPQKQLAVASARHDWVLCIDADEIVSPELAASIEQVLAAPDQAVYAMARCNRFMGRWLRHGEGYPDWSVRLFDRRQAQWSDDFVHERVLTSAPIGRLRGDLLHDSAETIATYLAKQDRYTSLQAERLAAASLLGDAGNAARMLVSPIVRFLKFYVARGGFLDGIAGLVHIAIGAKTSFDKYRKALRGHRTDGGRQ